MLITLVNQKHNWRVKVTNFPLRILYCSINCLLCCSVDRSRVTLWPYTGMVGSDYINASFVDVSNLDLINLHHFIGSAVFLFRE